MAVLRAVAVFESDSGLARDRRVNTFHFEGNPIEATVLAIVAAVRRFYTIPLPIHAFSLDTYLANHLNTWRIKVYDVTNEPSGPPIYDVEQPPLAARANAEDMPSEVAICLSYQGTPEAGLVQRRRRGRIYFGPVNLAARAPVVLGPSRPLNALLGGLREAGQRLAVDVDPDAEWVVYSRPFAGRGEVVRPGRPTLPAIPARGGSTVNIDEVWTDDAWDTQRRRGERATAKALQATGE